MNTDENYILVNITYLESKWQKIETNVKSNFGYVKEGNYPHESLNFKFDKPIDKDGKIYGYFQTHKSPVYFSPNVRNKIIFFYSSGKLVGCYGNSDFHQEKITYNFENIPMSANISGDKELSLLFETELDAEILRKSYPDRIVPQINWRYIQPEIASEILVNARETTKTSQNLDKINKLISSIGGSLVIKKWNLIRDQVLARLRENPGWTSNLERIFSKFGNINDVNQLSREDLDDLWFSSNNIAHVTYSIDKKAANEVYFEATQLLITKDKNYGMALKKCKDYLNKNLKNGVTGGQIGNILRTLIAVNNLPVSLISRDAMRRVLEYFGYYSKLIFDDEDSFNEGFSNIISISETISKYENLQDFEKRKLLWYTNVILEEGRLVPQNFPSYFIPQDSKNIILYGPPGTGKTFKTKSYAVNLIMESKV